MKKSISIGNFISTDDTQSRERETIDAIQDYVDIYKTHPDNPPFPPMVVAPAIGSDNKYFVIDGHHRLHAAKIAFGWIPSRGEEPQDKSLECEVVEPMTQQQALEASCLYNHRVGVRLTVSDKRKQIKIFLEAHPTIKISTLAEKLNVTEYMVKRVYDQLASEKKLEERKSPKQKALEAISLEDNTHKSTRKISEETGISEATIRRAKRQKIKLQNDSEMESTVEGDAAEFEKLFLISDKAKDYLAQNTIPVIPLASQGETIPESKINNPRKNANPYSHRTDLFGYYLKWKFSIEKQRDELNLQPTTTITNIDSQEEIAAKVYAILEACHIDAKDFVAVFEDLNRKVNIFIN